jgi:hypothetical protein
MSGTPANPLLGTTCHYYASTGICHSALVIVIDANYVATLRRMDGVVAGAPLLDDHPGIPYDYQLTATQTWHDCGSCTNTNP